MTFYIFRFPILFLDVFWEKYQSFFALSLQMIYILIYCGVTKNAVCRCSLRYTVYHTENSNHLEQHIGIIWHKRSMLVNDNTAECNVSQEKKKQSRKYLR